MRVWIVNMKDLYRFSSIKVGIYGNKQRGLIKW